MYLSCRFLCVLFTRLRAFLFTPNLLRVLNMRVLDAHFASIEIIM